MNENIKVPPNVAALAQEIKKGPNAEKLFHLFRALVCAFCKDDKPQARGVAE